MIRLTYNAQLLGVCRLLQIRTFQCDSVLRAASQMTLALQLPFFVFLFLFAADDEEMPRRFIARFSLP